MKILIDNAPLEPKIKVPESFAEFCEQIMSMLLARDLSIGSCEFDGTTVSNLEDARELFARSETCKIATKPFAVALEGALAHKCRDARRLEIVCEGLITQVLLGEPAEVTAVWNSVAEEIKGQVEFIPRLSALLTESQIKLLVERQVEDIGRVMHALHAAFNNGDALEISDSIELRLLPWLRQLLDLMENCLQLVKKLHR